MPIKFFVNEISLKWAYIQGNMKVFLLPVASGINSTSIGIVFSKVLGRK